MKEKPRKHWKEPLFLVLAATILVRLVYLLFDYPLWWDSHVYVSIGKYIFSGGQFGIWESFRPLLHPIVLGSIWKMGFDPFLVGKILDVIFSTWAVYLVYRIGKRIFSKKTGLIAAVIFSLSPVFLFINGLVLADPLAMVLVLGGSLFVLEGKMLFGGFLLGLSFLTRFPYGVWLGGLLIALLLAKQSMGRKISNIVALSLGFLTPVIPFLIFNHRIYGSALEPFIAGSWIVTTATWLYGSGFFFYFQYFFLENSLLFFFFGYVYFFLKHKEYSQFPKAVVAIVPLLALLYFMYVPRKETRYMLVALPLLCLAVAHVLVKLHQRLKESKKPFIHPQALVIICMILLLVTVPRIFVIERMPTFEHEIQEVISTRNISGLILASDPSFVSFLNQRIVTLDGMDFSNKIYEREEGTYELIFINDCDLICAADDSACANSKEQFLEKLNQENQKIFEKKFIIRRTNELCTYSMYVP
jgi:4-amino-4-deoxy-L-arabinose transferase-like glycosyltransferase